MFYLFIYLINLFLYVFIYLSTNIVYIHMLQALLVKLHLGAVVFSLEAKQKSFLERYGRPTQAQRMEAGDIFWDRPGQKWGTPSPIVMAISLRLAVDYRESWLVHPSCKWSKPAPIEITGSEVLWIRVWKWNIPPNGWGKWWSSMEGYTFFRTQKNENIPQDHLKMEAFSLPG